MIESDAVALHSTKRASILTTPHTPHPTPCLLFSLHVTQAIAKRQPLFFRMDNAGDRQRDKGSSVFLLTVSGSRFSIDTPPVRVPVGVP